MRLAELQHDAQFGDALDIVRNDDPCAGLVEIDVLVPIPDHGEVSHRYQVVYVSRHQTTRAGTETVLRRHLTDMGPTVNWLYPPLRIFADGALTVGDDVDTVGEVRDLAADIRALHDPLKNFEPNEDMMEDVVQGYDSARKYLDGRKSQFGAGRVTPLQQRSR
jgi:hypothetical protein